MIYCMQFVLQLIVDADGLTIPNFHIVEIAILELRSQPFSVRSTTILICPSLSGPETKIVRTTKGALNAEQEA